MNRPAQKWLRRGFLFITCSVALYAGLTLAARAIVRAKLDNWAELAGSRIAPGKEPVVEIDLLGGSLQVSGLKLEHLYNRDASTIRCSGDIDTLSIMGLSYWGLVRDRLVIDVVRLHARDLDIAVGMDTTRASNAAAAGPDKIMVAHAEIRLDRPRVRSFGIDTSGLAVREFRYHGGGISLLREGLDQWAIGLPGDRELRIDSLCADVRGRQCVQLGLLELDQSSGTCSLKNMHFGPYMDLEAFAKRQDLERDVADCHFPSIALAGLHIPSAIGAMNVSARSITITDADVRIFRDLTRPDGPVVTKPLVARLLRMFPAGAGADSIVLRSVDIVYNERGVIERGFGEVPFRDMDAEVVNARHADDDSLTFGVHARCTAFERAAVDFRFTTRAQDTTDHFRVVARIGRMPLRDINGALGPLADMQAMTGAIDTVVMRMDADDRQARGKVRLAYHDLRIVQGDVSDKKARAKPLSILMNAIIPNEQELGDIAATDELFTLPRARDRSIFNYLWRGLRDGSKKVLLPEILHK